MLKSCDYKVEEKCRKVNKAMKYMKKPDQQMGDMGKLYDEQAPVFAAKSKELVWWTTVGKPAYDRHLGIDFYGKKRFENC